ncbi:MAG TPA: hypothetical protein PKN24_15990 [bacterium]|jgi:hypothetical protein|nr:hypothetical protein [bacterium]
MNLKEKFAWLPGERLEVGMYDEAIHKGKAFGEWLEGLKHTHQGSPYAGMTQIEMIKSKILAKSSGKLVVPTAFDELMAHFNLNIGGAASDSLGKFFAYSDSSVLLGEYISQVVAASLIRTSLASELTALQERISEVDFRRTYFEDAGEDLELAEVSKDQELPDIWINIGDQSMRLIKYGRYLKANFEDVDRVSFNALNVVLNRIGMQIGVAETSEGIRVAVDGDGNSNAATTFNPTTTNTLNTTEVIKLATELDTPYQTTHLIAKKDQMQAYLAAAAGVSSVNGPNLLGAINVDSPKWVDWDKGNTGLESDYILIMDSRYCLGNVSGQAVFVESERLVKKQLKGTGIWYRSAFYKIDNNACKVMDVTFN